MSDTDEAHYKFQLVQFVQSQKKGTRDIEIVPACWISCDWKTKLCNIKYPPPPYTKKSCDFLQSRVQKEQPPLEKWPTYNIDIIGGAATYDVALLRLEKLRTEAYAFTTDGEKNPEIKASQIIETMAKKSMKELFDVPCLQNDDNKVDVSSGTCSRSCSTSSTSSPRLKKSRKPRKKSTKKKAIRSRESPPSTPEKTLVPDSVDELTPKNARDRNNNGEISTSRQSNLANLPATTAISSVLSDKGAPLKTSATSEAISTMRSETSSDKNSKSKDFADNTRRQTSKVNAHAERKKTNDVCSDEFDEQIQSHKTYSPDTIFLTSILKRFSIDLRNNTAAINALHDALAEKGSVNSTKMTIECFGTDYQLELPFETLQEFQEFDTQLENNQECNNNLISSLRHLMDRSNNVTKSCTTIFRKFFSREVMGNFTAKKKMEGKTLLRSTYFGKCMISGLIRYHTHSDGTPVKDDEVLKCAGNAICNSKDWDGRRRPLPKQ